MNHYYFFVYELLIANTVPCTTSRRQFRLAKSEFLFKLQHAHAPNWIFNTPKGKLVLWLSNAYKGWTTKSNVHLNKIFLLALSPILNRYIYYNPGIPDLLLLV